MAETQKLLALASGLALSLFPTFGFSQNLLQNGGFESGSGENLSGWFVPPIVRQSGYSVQLRDNNPKEGAKCVSISLDTRRGEGIGNILQSIDVSRYRGKRLRFRAAVRYERGSEPGNAAMWFRVDRPNGQMGYFNNMMDRPITSPNWTFYEITGDIAADAEELVVGVMLVGGGRAFVDAASVEVAAPPEPVVKPRALTPRGLENLVAYTRLVGYVRHFHPSDAAVKADWDRYTMAGIVEAEAARDPQELAQRLEAFIKPLAPTVRVFPTGGKPSPVPTPTGTQIVTRVSMGFGGGTTQGIYNTRRVFAKKGTEAPEPITADLGGGVSCTVPLALAADRDSALPATKEPEVPAGVRAEPTGNDRTSRLAAVALGWNVFQHYYPYFDVVKVDWNAVLVEALTSAATDADQDAFLKTLRRMVAAAKDGHGNVLLPSSPDFATPPISVEFVEDRWIVTAVDSGIASIKPGDELVTLDGKPTADAWKETSALISGATDGWVQSVGRRTLLSGKEGSKLQAGFRRGSGQPFTVSLTRNNGVVVREKRPQAIEEIKPGIWYVDLDTSRADMAKYQAALRDLTAAQGVIFDLRGYPNEVAMDVIRRAADKPITSALWNVPKVTKPDHQGFEFVQSRWNEMPPLTPRFRGKIAFLTGGGAISYAESVMGIVENYKLGAIVGSTTAGTNGNINPFVLPGGYTVVFTGMKVLKHDGSVHHGVGIKPTVPVSRTIAGITAGKDEVLEKAIAVVRGE